MGNFGGLHSSTAVAEFNDEAACHTAFAAMKAIKNSDHGIWGVCVPKDMNGGGN
jgi:hypothetical protein